MPKGRGGAKGNIAKASAGVLVTAIILFVTVRDLGSLDPSQLFYARVNWWLAGLSGLLFAASTWFRGMCYPHGVDEGISPLLAWRMTAVGNAANMLLPFKMGEGVRLALFPRGYSALRRVELTTVTAAADIACILLGALSAVLFAGFGSPDILRALGMVTVLFTVGCVGAVLLLLIFPRTSAAARRLPRARLIHMFFWVLASWVLLLGSVWAALLAVGVEPFQAGRAALFLFAALNFITLIPSSPGAIGIFEYSVAYSLQTLGLSLADAKTAALLLHVTQYAFLIPLALTLWLLGMHNEFPLKKSKSLRYNR